MVKYSSMFNRILLLIFFLFFISCNDQGSKSTRPEDSNEGGSYTFNPDLPTAGIVDFAGFSNPTIRIISHSGEATKKRKFLLEIGELKNETYIYFYTDPICITGYLGESEVSSEIFDYEINLGEKFPDGKFKIYTRLEDANGFFSDCIPTDIFYDLDTTPPNEPIIQLFSPSVPRGNFRTLEFLYSNLEINALYDIYLDEFCADPIFQFTATSESESLVVSLLGQDDNYSFYYKMTDYLGNVSSCYYSNLSFYLDTTPPESPLIDMVSEKTIPDGIVDIHYPNPTISISRIENHSRLQLFISFNEENANCEIKFYDEILTGLDKVSPFELQIGLDKGEGIYKIYSIITDAFGNKTDCQPHHLISYDYKFLEPNIVPITSSGATIVINQQLIGADKIDLPVETFINKNFVKVTNLVSGFTFDFFIDHKNQNSSCEVSDSTQLLDSVNISKLEFDLKNGEGIYTVYSKTTDSFGHSKCFNQLGVSYEFLFNKPSLEKVNPKLDFIKVNTATIKFSDIKINGKARFFQTHNNSEAFCDNSISDWDILNDNKVFTVNLSSGDGHYNFFIQLEDNFGNLSECFSYDDIFFEVDTIAPDDPIAGSHVSIGVDESGKSQFLFTYIGGSINDLLYLYSDATCSTNFGEFIFENDGYYAGIKNAKSQTVNIYAKFIDKAGNESGCSGLLGEYQLQLKVTGTLTYDYIPVSSNGILFDQTEIRPIRNAYIELIDMDSESTDYNKAIYSGSTDDNGYFEYFLGSIRTLKLVLHAKMLQPETTIYDNPENYLRYAATSTIREVTGHEIINLHAESGWEGSQSSGSYAGERAAAPFAILDTIYSAYKKINEAKPGLYFNHLDVFWNKDSTDGTYFCPSYCLNHSDKVVPFGLYLKGQVGSDTDEFDRHLIIHEWGHFFENYLSRSNSMGGNHGLGDTKDMSLSFGEGFATALSGMVFEPDAVYTDTYYYTSTYIRGFSIDIEGGSIWGDSNPGWWSEISVMQIVYDICDGAVENAPIDDDDIALGIGPIIDVFTNYQIYTPAKTSIFSFVNGIKMLNPGNDTEIDDLTTAKGIVSIIDDWGTGNNAYISINPNSSQSFSIQGNLLANDKHANQHLKFRANSSKTKFSFTGNDKFFAIIDYKNMNYFRAWTAATSHSATITTTPGEYYSIRVYSTDKDATKTSINITVAADNI